jgi:transposase
MRRSKLNEEVQKRIIQAIQMGATYEIAAEHAGICRKTLYSWIEKGKTASRGSKHYTFLHDFRKAEARAALTSLTTIQKEIQNGDWKAAAWFLDRRAGFRRDATITNEANLTKSQEAEAEQIPDYRKMMTIQISELRQSMDKAKDSGSWQAYAALQRQLVSLMQSLRAYDAEEGSVDAHERMTDDQLMSEIVNTIIALPPILRQRVQADLHSLVGSNVVALKKA